MAQTEALIATLKKALKNSQLTYAEVGRRLNMSEANVKRMFATRRFSLDRLEQICRLMRMDLTDLVQLYEQSRQRITQLTLEQEEELVKDRLLLLVAVAVRNRLTFAEILENYRISETDCIRCLARLDRLQIIDLLPQNRIKLRIDEDFRWQPHGPIERFFEQQVQAQFLKSSFGKALEKRLFVFGLLAENSIGVMQSRMQTLSREFIELHRQDTRLPLEKRHTVGFMLALRPWDAEVFQPFMKRAE